MDAVELNLFSQRIAAVCDEMGARLRQAAFSPNIRDRLDYSCAVFDVAGRLVAQAAHIPVHLGSMAYALKRIVGEFEWRRGDMLAFNDPFLGGTHLPDVTVVAPVFVRRHLVGFVANRAHHADIGSSTPGSMPLSSTLAEEGVVISPQYLVKNGHTDHAKIERFVAASCSPRDEAGDYAAQIAANRVGGERLSALASALGVDAYAVAADEINRYGERLGRKALAIIPHGAWSFSDYLDDDGFGATDIPIRVTLDVGAAGIRADFAGTAAQVKGNVNCPLAVTVAAVQYVFRCFLPAYAPTCHGVFAMIEITAPAGSLVNAVPPAAVAGGNVETSSRIVDCVIGALGKALPDRMPAASQGTMNNLAVGSAATQHGPAWAYYETIGGGCGADARGPGRSAVQSHMTNTLNTPVEVLEMKYPLRIRRYAVRRGSGGRGRSGGGDGVVREYEFLQPAVFTILSERRRRAPWGAAGGGDGASGENLFNGGVLPAKVVRRAEPGDCLTIKTPGGGAYHAPDTSYNHGKEVDDGRYEQNKRAGRE